MGCDVGGTNEVLACIGRGAPSWLPGQTLALIAVRSMRRFCSFRLENQGMDASDGADTLSRWATSFRGDHRDPRWLVLLTRMTMNRILALSSTGLLLAASAVAQCLPAPTGTSVTPQLLGWSGTFTTTWAPNDEGLTSPPITFTAFPNFPMAGATGNLDQMWVNSNGDLYFTDSTLALANVVGGASIGISSLLELRGNVANGSARIAVLGDDQQGSIAVGAVWDIKVDQTVPGEVRICWTDMRRFANATDRYSFSCTLFSSGAVRMDYGTIPALTDARIVGISRGNLVGLSTTPAQDLSAGVDSGTLGLIFQTFSSTVPFDLGNKTVMFVPNGIGGYTTSVICDIPPAAHSSYNKGCYSVANSVYEFFADAAAASPALTGNAVTFLNTGSGYIATWIPGGAAGYVVPGGGATNLPLSDDSTTAITPSVPLTVPGGTVPTLRIEHNGNIICSATANHSGDWTPTGAEMTGAAAALGRGFYSWHDYNNAEVGSGPIQWEQVTVGPDQVVYVTWNGVENYATPEVLNPSTIQYQINLTTGNVTLLWVAVDANITTANGTAHLVGYTAPGLGTNPGSTVLAAAATNVNDVAQNPLTLSAAPAPTFTLGGSSVPITYTTSNLKDLAPAVPGVYLAAMAFSINVLPPGPGFDLTFIGLDAPGCDLNVATIDVYYPINPVANTHNEVIVVPQPLAPGDTFYVQSVNFFIPNQLPNGQNNAGIITSNGIRSVFQTF